MRRKDSNQRPLGYEPNELPTAPLRDIKLRERQLCEIGAGNRARTGTGLLPRDFKSRASACSATPARCLSLFYYYNTIKSVCQYLLTIFLIRFSSQCSGCQNIWQPPHIKHYFSLQELHDEQPLHPAHPPTHLPFFLSLIITAITAATISKTTIDIIIVDKFCNINSIILRHFL